MMSSSLLLFLLGFFGVASGDAVYYAPQQIHIAEASSSEMIIVWNTFNDTLDSRVLFGKERRNLNQVVTGNRTKFTDGGSEKRFQFVHMVTLTGLEADTDYYYTVGSEKYSFSDLLSFKTWPEGNNWSPGLAIFGDFGDSNAQSLTRIQMDTLRGMYDAILHVGDFAYNFASDNARVGDSFMRQIEPVASAVPYMTCVGNHEYAYNFSNYKNRFRMPGDIKQRMFYSFKMGPVRFISTNTEAVFFPSYGLYPLVEHYQWLENELKDANLPENRAKQPWVITFGHRPMYCSNENHDDCTRQESIIRTGIEPLHIFGWEKLFYEYGVDIALWAHEHSYERLWPLYNRKVMNGSYDHPYTNPKAPVHIITGSAGCREKHNPFNKTKPAWSAFRSDDYGYTRMKVFNATHIYMEQVSDDKGGEIIDRVMVIKEKHGAYEYDPRPVVPVGDHSELVNKWSHMIRTNGIDLP